MILHSSAWVLRRNFKMIRVMTAIYIVVICYSSYAMDFARFSRAL